MSEAVSKLSEWSEFFVKTVIPVLALLVSGAGVYVTHQQLQHSRAVDFAKETKSPVVNVGVLRNLKQRGSDQEGATKSASCPDSDRFKRLQSKLAECEAATGTQMISSKDGILCKGLPNDPSFCRSKIDWPGGAGGSWDYLVTRQGKNKPVQRGLFGKFLEKAAVQWALFILYLAMSLLGIVGVIRSFNPSFMRFGRGQVADKD